MVTRNIPIIIITQLTSTKIPRRPQGGEESKSTEISVNFTVSMHRRSYMTSVLASGLSCDRVTRLV